MERLCQKCFTEIITFVICNTFRDVYMNDITLKEKICPENFNPFYSNIHWCFTIFWRLFQFHLDITETVFSIFLRSDVIMCEKLDFNKQRRTLSCIKTKESVNQIYFLSSSYLYQKLLTIMYCSYVWYPVSKFTLSLLHSSQRLAVYPLAKLI